LGNLNLEDYTKFHLDEEIPSLPEELFSLDLAVSRAMEQLDILKKNTGFYLFSIEEDFWELESHLQKGVKIYLDFSLIEKYKEFPDIPKDIKLITKCWIIELLTKVYPITAKKGYSDLLRALELSNGFQENKVDFLIRSIKNFKTTTGDKVMEETKKSFIRSLINFFIYTDIPVSDSYSPKLNEMYSKIREKTRARILPPAKEILIFSHYIEEYYGYLRLMQASLDEKIFYYPIIIWWKLTTIIPLRASEFCLITRDCLIYEDNKYKIRLPRSKEDFNPNRIQIIDIVEVTKEIYFLIKDYIDLTDPYGHSETLISYRALIFADKRGNRSSLKADTTYFHNGILSQLLRRFYKNIIEEKYNQYVPYENRLTPNLTRHIAFSSLMMQGISPIEIARLGGHKTITAQYHYSFHTEYWVDSEVFNLMKKFKYSVGISKSDNVNYIPDTIKLVAYLGIPNGKKKEHDLDIGFCIDKDQTCETNECIYGCSHWRITPKEILEKEHLIKEKLRKKRSNINELQTFLINIHKQILSDEITRRNPSTFNLMKTKAEQLKEEIYELASIEMLNIGGEF